MDLNPDIRMFYCRNCGFRVSFLISGLCDVCWKRFIASEYDDKDKNNSVVSAITRWVRDEKRKKNKNKEE